MECDGLVRSERAARIPIQLAANSASSSSNKQLEGHETHQPRYRRHQQQQQQQQQQRAARDNHTSSINGSVTSTPPSQPPLSRHMADSVDALFREWDSGLRPLTVTCRPDPGRRLRQRVRSADERATRGRVDSDSGRTVSSGAGDSLKRSVVTHSAGAGSAGTAGGYSSGDDSGDDVNSVISQTRSTSTRSPGQITTRQSSTIIFLRQRNGRVCV